MSNLFDKLDAKQPPTAERKTEQLDDAQLLLNWLQRRSEPVVSTKNICQFGPHALRNGERALRSAQVLAAQGWLTPLTERKWQVVRKILAPT